MAEDPGGASGRKTGDTTRRELTEVRFAEPAVASAYPRSRNLWEGSRGSESINVVLRANASPGPMQPVFSKAAAQLSSSPGADLVRRSRLATSDLPDVRRPLADVRQAALVPPGRKRSDVLSTDASFTCGGIR